MNILFFKGGAFFYLLGTLVYLSYIIFLKEVLSKTATAVVLAGFGLHTLALLARYAEAGHTPVTNLYESLSFFAWMVVGVLLVVNRKYRVKVLGPFLCTIALILMIFGLALPKDILPLAPALESFWHPFHVFFAFLGNAIFALAFCCGVLYLVQEYLLKSQQVGSISRRLPSLKVLDDLNYRSLIFGFPSLTLGIITGAIWAEYAWGRYWGWDPKETWSLITWMIYAFYLHARLRANWRPPLTNAVVVVGIIAILFTFLGVSQLAAFSSSNHYYGSPS